ncbi:ATP-binding cassette domain-containing protein [Solilutibacter silvestris]|uniref:ABC-type multidrug transport system ATPase n=1 Tax=Solilutibacter silvestris TaxID=1645665 RepID=A0A2K1PX07_9GAMM|nr:ATP-binding cassette domain-containing protein [Lysobacter silvestris]PNS07322.1 ABC-type multidrug transport system ATPase [Lysobacter silvestris]
MSEETLKETSWQKRDESQRNGRASLLRTYIRALALLARERRLAYLLVLTNLGLAAVFLLEPWFFGRVIDALSAGKSADAWKNIGFWTAIGVAGIVTGVFSSLHADRLAHRCRMEVMAQYIEHVISLPISFHDRNHSGGLLLTMHTGTSFLFNVWLTFFRTHLSTLISVLVVIPLTLYLNWKLAIPLLGMMASFLALSIFMVRRNTKAQMAVVELNKRIGDRAGDLFANVMVIQSYLRVASEMKVVRNMLENMLNVQYPVLRGFALSSIAQRTASTLTVVVIFALGVCLNGIGEITVGGIVSFVGFAMLMLGRLEQLAYFLSDLSRQALSIGRFFTILDTCEIKQDRLDAPDLHDVRGEVVFDNVSFHYEPQHGEDPRYSLKDLSFKVLPGQMVALVGATGSGKTTALSLLYRAYDPSRGCIFVDGVDIRNVSRESLRRQMAVVFQEPGLLNRSIADNLRMGWPEASDAEVEAAAVAAQAHTFVTMKPDGYGTMVTERGRSLSGGERQRLAIARALLKNAPILVLDEATSALDVVTEMHVQKSLRNMTKPRTTIVIAHRLSTIRHADVILVLDNGLLTEQGTFDFLVQKNGMFADLVRSGEFSMDASASPANATSAPGASTTEMSRKRKPNPQR